MKPNNKTFPASSGHPFYTVPYDPKAYMHARDFSSPFFGTLEDLVKGKAPGVMGGYFSPISKPI